MKPAVGGEELVPAPAGVARDEPIGVIREVRILVGVVELHPPELEPSPAGLPYLASVTIPTLVIVRVRVVVVLDDDF